MMRAGVGSLIDLRPVPRLKHMNGGVLGLRFQVLGDADMKIGVGFPPDEQEGQVGAPEIGETGGICRDFVEELVGHLREGRTGAWPLRKVLVHDRHKKLFVARLVGIGNAVSRRRESAMLYER